MSYVDEQDPNNLVNKVRELESRLKQLENRGLAFGSLEEITADIGLQTAGEFRSGEGEPGSGFTGGRFGSPGFFYNGKYWFFVGVNADRMMVGLDLETGEICAAGGALTLGEQGIVLEGIMAAITQKATGGWLGSEEVTRYGRLGMFIPEGSKMPVFGIEYLDDVSGNPVLTNGLFGTGDLTGWTASGGGGTKFSVITDKLPGGMDGYLLESAERPLVSDEETLTGISDAVVAGDKYLFDLWTRDGTVITDLPVTDNLVIDESNPTTAQGGLADFAANAWLEAGHYLGQLEQRTLLNFDKSALANVSVVDEAGLVYYIRKNGLTLGTTPLSIRYLLAIWDWATATWNKKNATDNWATAGAKGSGTDIAADIVGSDSIVAANTEEGYRYTDIDPAIIQDWIDNAITFNGLIMTGTTLTGNNALDIGLKEKGVGAFLRISERPVYKIEINWFDGAGATGTLIRTDNIAAGNDIQGWNERKAILTVPVGAVSFSFVVTAARGKLFQVANISVKKLGVNSRVWLGPDLTYQDNDGIRKVLTVKKELVKPTSVSSGFVAGTITQGATKSNGNLSNSGSNLTVSHTVDAGSNGVMIVQATLYSATSGRQITGITWNGNAMTNLGRQRSGDNLWEVSLWGYKLGDVGSPVTANIVATPSGTGSYVGLIATNYYNVMQDSTTFGTAVGATGTATSISATVTTAAQDMVVASAADYNSTTPVCGNTSDGRYMVAGSLVYFCASHQTASGASTAMSWSGGTSVLRAILAIPLKPRPASGNVDAGDHYYCVTFYDESGETEAGTASAVVTVPTGGGSVNLLSVPIGQYGASGRKIYRSKAGTSSPFYLLTSIADNTTTTYTDQTADADLGETTPPLVNTTASRPQFSRTDTKSCLSLVSNATLSITDTGVAPLVSTSAANANDGDYFDTSFWLAAGTYTLYIHCRKETTAGKIDIYLDDVSVATAQDLYAAAGAAFVLAVTGVVVTGSGYHKLRIKINGKNASSSDYTFGCYSITMKAASY